MFGQFAQLLKMLFVHVAVGIFFSFRGALVVNSVSNKDACGACHTHTHTKTLLNEPESSSAKSSCGKKIKQMTVSRHKNKGIPRTFTR